MASKTKRPLPLLGMRILVVDDEFLIAVNIEDTLREAGAEIVSASTLGVALKAAADNSLSAAVLDVRLGRETTEEVADALAVRAIPFVFHTGHTLPARMSEKHPTMKVIIKPASQDAFVEAMVQAKRRSIRL